MMPLTSSIPKMTAIKVKRLATIRALNKTKWWCDWSSVGHAKPMSHNPRTCEQDENKHTFYTFYDDQEFVLSPWNLCLMMKQKLLHLEVSKYMLSSANSNLNFPSTVIMMLSCGLIGTTRCICHSGDIHVLVPCQKGVTGDIDHLVWLM